MRLCTQQFRLTRREAPVYSFLRANFRTLNFLCIDFPHHFSITWSYSLWCLRLGDVRKKKFCREPKNVSICEYYKYYLKPNKKLIKKELFKQIFWLWCCMCYMLYSFSFFISRWWPTIFFTFKRKIERRGGGQKCILNT